MKVVGVSDPAPPPVFPAMLFMLAGARSPFKQDPAQLRKGQPSSHAKKSRVSHLLTLKKELHGRIKKRPWQLFLSS